MSVPSDDLNAVQESTAASWLKDAAVVFVIYLLIVTFFRELVFGGEVFVKAADGITAGVLEKWGREVLQRGIFPLWNPYIFSGMPSFGSLQFNPETYPADWFRSIYTFLFFGGSSIRILFHHLLGGIFMYMLLRDLDLPRTISLFGSVVFFFSPQEIVLGPVAHGGKLFAISYLPLLLLLTRRFLKSPDLVMTAALAVVIALQLLALHMQIAYYGLMMIGLYFAIDALHHRKQRDAKGHLVRLTGLLGAGLLALALSAYLLWPVYEYSQFSIRGGAAVGGGVSYEYATSWSFHPLESLTLLVPSWFGFSVPSYWGYMPFTDHPYYMGLVPLLLAVVALVIRRRDRLVQVCALIGGFSLLVSFGKWFPVVYGVLFKILPFYAKFRVPAMILILLLLAVAVLAALGMQGLLTLEGDERARWCRILKFTAIAMGVIFLVVLAGKSAFRVSYESAAAVKAGQAGARNAYGLFWADLLRVVGITGLAALALHFTLRDRLPKTAAAAAVCLLVVADLWIVNARLVETVPRAVEFESIRANPHAEYLASQTGPFRLLNIPAWVPGNYWMSQGLEDVEGYSPAKLRLYQQLLERQEGRMQLLNVLAMLNTKYILYHEEVPAEGFTRVFSSGGVHIYEYEGALGPAWLVGEAITVRDDETVMNSLLQGFDVSDRALSTETIGPLDVQAAAAGQVTLLERDIHKLRYRVEAGGPVLLVLSEVYYPAGWTATVDGSRAPIHRVNHVLRAVRVEPPAEEGGVSVVELEFAPVSVHGGRWLSIGTLPIVLAIAVVGVWRRRKKAAVPEAGAGIQA